MPVDQSALGLHFNLKGEPKRSYPTLAEAIYAARLIISDEGPFRAYPCHCRAYHIGLARPGQDHGEGRPEVIRWALEEAGWKPNIHVTKKYPDGAEFWTQPEIGANKVPLYAAWRQVYAAADVVASRWLANRPEVRGARAHVRGNETDEEKRRILQAAGWRRVNNPDTERWRRPGVTARSRRSSNKAGKPLANAWRLFVEGT